MNKAMIYEYCEVACEKGDMILYRESGDPFWTAENLATGEQWSCHSIDDWFMLCED